MTVALPQQLGGEIDKNEFCTRLLAYGPLVNC